MAARGGAFFSKLKTFAGMTPPEASRNAAKERLQIILAHQRGSQLLAGVNLEQLQKELLACVQRHVAVADGAPLSVSVKQDETLDIFEMQVPINAPSDRK